MAQRLSQRENEAITRIRNNHRSTGQRTLARAIVDGDPGNILSVVDRSAFGFSSLQGRPFATVYNAIRRFDKTNPATPALASTTDRRSRVLA